MGQGPYNADEVMAVVLYIDRLFLINAVVDYLLLLTTAQIMGLPLRRWRFCLVSLLGGGYAAAAVLAPQFGLWWLKIAVGSLMAALAFRQETVRYRAAALFLLLSGAMAGAMLAVAAATGQEGGGVYFATVGWRTLLLSAALFYILLTILFYQKAKHGGGELMEVTVAAFGRQCRIKVLRDNGNALRNPADGKPVLVAEAEAVRSLLPEGAAAIVLGGGGPEEKMAALYDAGFFGFALLPFHSIGCRDGLLLALKSDAIRAGRRTLPKTMIALYHGTIGGGIYHGLWGGEGYGAALAEDTAVDTALQAG